MRGSKSILLAIVRGSCGSMSIVSGGTCAAIKILRMPAIITAVARLGVRKKKWRMRTVKKDVAMTRFLGRGLLK